MARTLGVPHKLLVSSTFSSKKGEKKAFIQSAAVHKTIDLAVHRNVG